MGWVDALRNHGSLIFIHLRDISGIVQVVFDPSASPEAHVEAQGLGLEDVIEIKGTVRERSRESVNPFLVTGELEVLAQEVLVYSKAGPLPFPVSEKAMVFDGDLQAGPWSVDEDLRLRYRYLDLRRPSLQEMFIKRHLISGAVREYLSALGFIEIETPVLTKSTPEGARDYLVPSRIHKGRFYALPQSPQLFKQLLMMAGFDRYYQIVRCFRDEDLRPNRQPEFTQLDLEASFIDEEFIYQLVEGLMQRVAEVAGVSLSCPFPRMTYSEAMDKYGTDRPDTRFDMVFEDLSLALKDTSYGVFRRIIEKGGVIKGICVRGKAGDLSKNILQNEYAMKIVPSFGAQGMTWMKMAGGLLHSNISQFFTPSELGAIGSIFRAQEGDVVMMIADPEPKNVLKALCSLRLHIAERLSMIPKGIFSCLWITDFPLFEEKEGVLGSQHHPFTMPDRYDFDPADRQSLLSLKSRAYDLVVNGDELGGGSIRIHDPELQRRVFRCLGLEEPDIDEKFGFFIKALQHGTPPHGGIALGLDRLSAMFLSASSIRDVIAFPKNRSAVCPLTQAPSRVSEEQLRELGIGLGTKEEDSSKGESGVMLEKSGGISIEEVQHLATLSRLSLDEDEANSLRADLNAILDYAATLSTAETESVEPMGHVLPLFNVWRDDKPSGCARASAILRCAPDSLEGFFKVPRILED
jgi:aspartyl-tRNA synthetase